VRPTTSVLKYAKETPDPAEVSKTLGVDSVLEGTYQRASGVIRVTVQLIDGHTGNTKWSQRYDLHSADILSFEDEVAGKVVEGLKIEVSPAEQKSIQQVATNNADAYNNYLQARFYFNQYHVDSSWNSLVQGKRLLLDAISLDKNFADAYALMAQTCAMQAANFMQDAAANLKQGETAAQTALRINPESARALMALSAIYGEEGREQEAIRNLRKSLEIAPNDEWAWQMLGYAYYYAGLNELSEQAYGRMIALNPGPPQYHWMHARMLLYSGKADQAEQELRNTLTRNPDQYKLLAYFAMVLYYENKLDEAETNFERSLKLDPGTGDKTPRMLAAFLYASRKQREKIDPQILNYGPDDVVDGDGAYWISGIHALLGERQKSLEWLRRAVVLGDVNYPWFDRDKNFDSIRGDAEYQSVMAGIRQKWEGYKKEFDPGR